MFRLGRNYYRHVNSGKIYNFIGVARSVEEPDVERAVYVQCFRSKLYGSDIELPNGTVWTRKLEDWNKKFVIEGGD